MKGVSNNNIIIFNILRNLGFSPSIKGTKLLISAIEEYTFSTEFILFIDLYNTLSKKYNLSPKNIEKLISYAIKSRIVTKSQKNFEKIFGYDYDEYVFTNKNFIEEIARIVKGYI